MTVRVYRWDDSSAPTLNGGAGSLITLLDAVLVNGYGSKTAAGWTKAYAGTNVAGYTNGRASSPQGIKVDHSTAGNVATIVGYESISGGGVVTDPFPTVAQASAGLYWYLTSETTPFNTINRPWMIVADEKRFYLWIGYSVTTATGLATTAYMQLYFAGDIASSKGDDLFHFALVGGTSNAVTNNAFGVVVSAVSSTQTGHYIARSYTQASGAKSILCGKVQDYSISSGVGNTGPIAYPDPVSGGMLMSPVRIVESSNLRGVFPGLWSPLHNTIGAMNSGDTFSGAGPLAGKTFILVDANGSGVRARFAIETSNTW